METNKKTSAAQIKANVKYNRSMDSITIRPSKEAGSRIRAAAQAAGKPLQRYILDIVLSHDSGDSDGTAGNP